MACEPSVLPLSATTISPSTPLSSRKRRALAMHEPIVSASSRQGMTMESSGGISDTLPEGDREQGTGDRLRGHHLSPVACSPSPPPEHRLIDPRIVEDLDEARIVLELQQKPHVLGARLAASDEVPELPHVGEVRVHPDARVGVVDHHPLCVG